MAQKRIGERTLAFPSRPRIVSGGSIAAQNEAEGPLGSLFDMVLEDDTWGEDSFEKAECRMFETVVRVTLDKASVKSGALHCLLGGDLLNQIVSAGYAARQLCVPFLGLYGACSTIAESILVGGMMVDGGFADTAACAASSHFSTAERQYRFPLEFGTTSPPTAQRTVTGAGCVLLSGMGPLAGAPFSHVAVTQATIGRVVDLGISDVSNMGAAMAPAAADTILTHLSDTFVDPSAYDLVVTGDLGKFGTQMLLSLLSEKGVDLTKRHFDCGSNVYSPAQGFNSGGSGCGCAAITLASYLLPRLERGELSRILFLATGALHSPSSNMQGETIPCIAHALVLESTQKEEGI